MKVGITLPVFCWLSKLYTLFCDCHTSPLGTAFEDCIVLQHDWEYWTVIECHLMLINMHVVICHVSHHWHFVIYVTVSIISTLSWKFSNLSLVCKLIKNTHNHLQEIVLIKMYGFKIVWIIHTLIQQKENYQIYYTIILILFILMDWIKVYWLTYEKLNIILKITKYNLVKM